MKEQNHDQYRFLLKQSLLKRLNIGNYMVQGPLSLATNTASSCERCRMLKLAFPNTDIVCYSTNRKACWQCQVGRKPCLPRSNATIPAKSFCVPYVLSGKVCSGFIPTDATPPNRSEFFEPWKQCRDSAGNSTTTGNGDACCSLLASHPAPAAVWFLPLCRDYVDRHAEFVELNCGLVCTLCCGSSGSQVDLDFHSQGHARSRDFLWLFGAV